MRKAALAVFLLALVLGAGRLFTGIVYGRDSAVAYLVLKHAPDFRIERPEADGRPIGQEVVLDAEEPDLAYERLYVGAMHAVPVLAGLMLATSVLLLLAPRLRRPRI